MSDINNPIVNPTTTVPAQAAMTTAPANTTAATAPAQAQVPTTAAPAQASKSAVDPLLTTILSTKRRHLSTGDTNFRIWLFNYLKGLKVKPTVMQEGCVYVTTAVKSTVLFSCHIDTVHSSAESDGSKQSLAFDEGFGHLFLSEKSQSGCLGGDDGCGIYIMLKMIAAKVPGHYVFHTGEEVGGIGANALVRANTKLLDDIEAVVAFDRPVRDDENPEVIITQGGAPCASRAFGTALCAELNKPEFGFEKPYIVSEKGLFTDSKIYAPYVPECINLGCFYNRQHGPDEYVDVYGLEKLVAAAIKIDWSKLPIVRKPGVYGGHSYDSSKNKSYQNGGFPAAGKPQQGGFQGFGGWEHPQNPTKSLPSSPFKTTMPAPSDSYYKSSLETVEETVAWLPSDYADFVENAELDEVVKLMMLMRLALTRSEASCSQMESMLGISS